MWFSCRLKPLFSISIGDGLIKSQAFNGGFRQSLLSFKLVGDFSQSTLQQKRGSLFVCLFRICRQNGGFRAFNILIYISKAMILGLKLFTVYDQVFPFASPTVLSPYAGGKS